MARNKISDLNDHLFAQLERLNDEDISSDDLKTEIERAKAISLISKNLIETAKVTLAAFEFVADTANKDDSIKRLTN